MKLKMWFLKIYKAFISFDIMSPSPEFNYKGDGRFTTFIGLILTLLALSFSVLAIYPTLENFIKKINPDVLISLNFDESQMILNNTNFPFFLEFKYFIPEQTSLEYFNKTILEPPEVVNIRQNSSGYFFITDTVHLVDCDDEIFKDFNSGFFSSLQNKSSDEIQKIKANSFCLPKNFSFSLERNAETVDQLTIGLPYNFYVSLLDSFVQYAVTVNYRQIAINPNNFDRFFSKIWASSIFFADTSYQNVYSLEIQNYYLTQDRTSFLFKDLVNLNETNVKSFSLYQSWERKHRIEKYDYLASLVIIKSETSATAYVRYTSFNDVFSAFGGTFEIFRSMFALVMSNIICYIYFPTISNDIFHFHVNEEAAYLKNNNGLIKYQDKEKGSPSTHINVNNFMIKKVSHQSEDIQILTLKDNDINQHKGNQSEVLDDFVPAACKQELIFQELKDQLEKKKCKQKQHIITSQEYFLAKSSIWRNCCTKNHLSNPKVKIIHLCEEAYKHFLDIHNLIHTEIEFSKLKEFLLPKAERNLIRLPSINLSNENSWKAFKFLSHARKTEIVDEDLKEIMNEMTECSMEQRLKRKIVGNLIKSII